ncbi:MAG TPA: GyrI-like domain-containing protein [Chitinophagaceae bacterium]|jgi:hypothetical protein|nr:GyrI-like domain-containing protein [Chitinophagaceae bacterium]
MMKTDLVKTDKTYYTARPTPTLVTLEPVAYLALEGTGDPSGAAFTRHIEALYTTAYTLKFTCKEAGADFTVPKLEGLWWYDTVQYGSIRPAEAAVCIPRSEWKYRLLIRMPSFINRYNAEEARKAALQRKGLPDIEKVTFFTMAEGLCVQLLHTGPFDREAESLEKIVAFMDQQGLRSNGLHHEIYLSDFRKTKPEALKTILREPAAPVAQPS